MKYLTILILALILSSCSSDDEGGDQFVVATALDISVKDAQGNDLLDPDNVNSLNENQIKLLFEINGEQVEFYDANLTYPKGFFLFQHENEYRLKVFPNTSATEANPVTYIIWNEDDIDTIKSEVKRTNNSEEITKVWFNDDLIWEGNESERYFEIIK